MNRTIKFRGKSLVDTGNIKKGDWVYGGIAYDADRVWIDMEYYGKILVDKDTVGQFTGLYDKNGKEIYEGDIVSFRYKKDRPEWADSIGFIQYQRQYCAFKIVVFTAEEAFKIDDETIIEVIGNLYENSEGLGGE